MFRKFLFSIAGYDAASIADEPRHRTHVITLIGGAVAVAVCTTSLCWAISGYTLLDGDGTHRWAGAAFGGLFGALVVITIDRIGVYAMDALRKNALVQTITFAVRIGLAVLLGTSSSQGIMPFVLKREATAWVLKQHDIDDAAHQKNSRSLYEIDERRDAAKDARTLVEQRKAEAAIVPPELDASEAAARACWQQYASQKAIASQGKTQVLRATLNRLAARCAAATNASRQMRAQWRDKETALVNEAAGRQQDAVLALADAEKKRAERTKDYEAMEKAAVSAESATVLEAVIASDWGAKKKYYSIFGVIVMLEILPLLLKLMLGQSQIGGKLAVDNEIEMTGHRRRAADAKRASEQDDGLRNLFDALEQSCLGSAEMQSVIRAQLEAKLEAYVPLEVAQRIVAKLETAIAAKEASERRYPNAAEAISATYQQAFEEVAAILRNATQPGRPMPQPA